MTYTLGIYTLGCKVNQYESEAIAEKAAKAEINRIYERTRYECKLVDFAELFYVVLEFLNENKFKKIASSDEIDNMVLKFTFTLASQDFYPILVQ